MQNYHAELPCQDFAIEASYTLHLIPSEQADSYRHTQL